MNEQPRSSESPPPGKSSRPMDEKKKRSPWIPVLVVAGAFLVGFVPMWLKTGRLSRELSRTQSRLQREQLQMTFANAALDARRGEYESARKEMANFFSLVTAELDRGAASVLPADTGAALQPLLAQRDDVITLLARGDPASAERLAIAYAAFRRSLGAPSP